MKGTVGKGVVVRGVLISLFLGMASQSTNASEPQQALRRLQSVFVNGSHVERTLPDLNVTNFWPRYLEDQTGTASRAVVVRSGISDWVEILSAGNWVSSITSKQALAVLKESAERLVSLSPEATWLPREVEKISRDLRVSTIQWGVDSTRSNSCGDATPFLIAFLPDYQTFFGIELLPCVGSE